MKWIIFLITFYQAAGAQVTLSTEIETCKRSCGPECLSIAQQAIAAGNQILQNCSTGTQNPIQTACVDSFVQVPDEQTCMSTAHSADAVRACVDTYMRTDDELQCVSSARSREIVLACSEGFLRTEDEFSCMSRARTADRVRSCLDQFIRVEDELNCIGSL